MSEFIAVSCCGAAVALFWRFHDRRQAQKAKTRLGGLYYGPDGEHLR